MGTHKKRLVKALLMSTDNICFRLSGYSSFLINSKCIPISHYDDHGEKEDNEHYVHSTILCKRLIEMTI